MLRALVVVSALLMHPVLHVKTTPPFAVFGARFAPGERVAVVLRMNGRHTQTAIANGEGRLLAVFRSISYDACSGYLVVATGDHGSRARTRLTPGCTRFEPAR